MGSTIATQAKAYLEKLQPETIRNILKTHLNENATTETELFTNKHPKDRSPANKDRLAYAYQSGLTFSLPLLSALAYAPLPVCEEIVNAIVTLDNERCCTLLSMAVTKGDKTLCENTLQTIIQYAPESCAIDLIERIKKLDNKQQEKVFSDKALFFEKFSGLSDAVKKPLIPIIINLIQTTFFNPENLISLLAKPLPSDCIQQITEKLNPRIKQLLERENTVIALFTPVFTQQSDTTILAFLPYLETLEAGVQLDLFRYRDAKNKSLNLLDKLLQRKDCQKSIEAILQLILANTELRLKLMQGCATAQSPLYKLFSGSNFSATLSLVHHQQFNEDLLKELPPSSESKAISSLIALSPALIQLRKNTPFKKLLPTLEKINSLHLTQPLVDGQTLLHYAAKTGCKEFTHWLCQQGLPLDKEDDTHKTPLDIAIEQRHMPLVVQWLDASPQSINAIKNRLNNSISSTNTPPLMLNVFNELPRAKSLIHKLKDYGEKNANTELYTLAHIAFLINNAKLAQPQGHIHSLLNNPNNNRLYLALFLLCLPEDKLGQIQFTKSLQQPLYQCLATHGLMNELSHPAQLWWIEKFHQLSENTTTNSQALARHVLSQWPWLELSAPIIQKHARTLDNESAQQLQKNRKGAAAQVIALENLGENHANTPQLLKALTQEITRLNESFSSPESLHEFKLTVQLAQSDWLKQFLLKNKLLCERVEQCILALNENDDLPEHSLFTEMTLAKLLDAHTVIMHERHPLYQTVAARLCQTDCQTFIRRLTQVIGSLNDKKLKYDTLQILEKTHAKKALPFVKHMLPDMEPCNLSFPIKEISAGLLKNPNNALLPVHEQWLLNNYLKEFEQELLSHYSQCIFSNRQSDLSQTLPLWEKTADLRLDLNLMALKSSLSFTNIVTRLQDEDLEQLQTLHAFSQQARLVDFCHFLEDVIEIKKNNAPLPTTPKKQIVGDWLGLRLNQIQQHMQFAFSLYALNLLYTQKPHTTLERLFVLLTTRDCHIKPLVIVKLLQHIVPLIAGNETPKYRQNLLYALAECLFTLKANDISAALQQLEPVQQQQLIAMVMRGLSAENALHQQSCQKLMTLLCQLDSSTHQQTIHYIKTHLGRQDMSCLGIQQTTEIAQTVLTNTSDTLLQSTLDGVWIQRLISDPNFIANTTPQTLKQLLDRYQLISLTLKQDEFQKLSQAYKKHMSFAQSITQGLSNKNADSERLQKLLKFRAEDCIRAMLIQLEEDLAQQQGETALKATRVLHEHYTNQLQGLRHDWWFKLSDYLVKCTNANKGDLQQAQSLISRWITKTLPHENFEQQELRRKLSNILCDENGCEIGYINENGLAMCFVEGEARPINLKAGHVFYNKERIKLGELTQSGHVRRENLFIYGTSAMILVKQPREALEKATTATALLLADCINEKTLDYLYNQAQSSEQQLWLQSKVHELLSKTTKPVAAEVWETLVSRHNPQDVLRLLQDIHSTDNARMLFQQILRKDSLRVELLKATNASLVSGFFAKHNACELFADYLQQFYSEKWFNKGFERFSQSALDKQPDLYAQSMRILSYRVQSKKLNDTAYQRIAECFLDEKNAHTLWFIFFHADNKTALQSIKPGQLATLCTFITRKHLHCAIQKLLNGSDNTPYAERLILAIAQHAHPRFFASEELRYDRQNLWTVTEVEDFCRFLKRCHCQADRGGKTHDLLSNLLLYRAANFGSCALFYDKDNEIDIRFCERELNLDSFKTSVAPCRFVDCDDSRELRAQKAIVNWKEVAEKTFTRCENAQQLPAITAFLLNYHGASVTLEKLLCDYSQNATHPERLKALSMVMYHAPQQEVSAVIFAHLETVFTSEPERLSAEVFMHMAEFYSHDNTLDATAKQLLLIQYFGGQKHYALTAKAAQLTRESLTDPNPSQTRLLTKIQTEADTEAALSQHRHHWYSKLLRWIRRLFAYSINWDRNRSDHVRFCEEETINHGQPEKPNAVSTEELSGALIEKNMQELTVLKECQRKLEVMQTARKNPPVIACNA